MGKFFSSVSCYQSSCLISFNISTIFKFIAKSILLQRLKFIKTWSDFDRPLSLICGNKMPTRCNRCFLLQILLLAQHVSGTIMPIIRSSRVLYSWLLPVVFGVRCPVCGLLPANQTHNPQLHTIPITWKPKHQILQAATNCIILSSSWWWA